MYRMVLFQLSINLSHRRYRHSGYKCTIQASIKFVLETILPLKTLRVALLMCAESVGILIYCPLLLPWGLGWRNGLVGRSRDRFPGFFSDIFSSDRTMTLRSTQPLVKMSTRNIPVGKGGWCVRPTTSPPSCAECHENLGA
jgi:hypothetical protein